MENKKKENESHFLKKFNKAKELWEREKQKKQDCGDPTNSGDPCTPLNSDDPQKPQHPYPYPGENEEPYIDPLQHPPIVKKELN